MSWIIGEHDQKRYQDLISLFLSDKTKHDSFRINAFYKSVLGEPPLSQAIFMIDEFKSDSDIIKKLPEFIKLDSLGSPIAFKFIEGNMSLNLVRYLDTIRLLKENFGNLDNLNITEIGVGFGGLAHCINTMWKPASYTLVDLPEAVSLAKHNLSLLGHVLNDYDGKQDLLIAEYSLSELDSDAILEYIEQHLMKSNRIFMRINFMDPKLRAEFLFILREYFDIGITKEVRDVVRMNQVLVAKRKGFKL